MANWERGNKALDDFKKELDKQFSGLSKWITEKSDQLGKSTAKPKKDDELYTEACQGAINAQNSTDPEHKRQWYLWAARTGEQALTGSRDESRWASVVQWYAESGDPERGVELLPQLGLYVDSGLLHNLVERCQDEARLARGLQLLLDYRIKARGELSLCLDVSELAGPAGQRLPEWTASWLLPLVQQRLSEATISPGDMVAALKFSALYRDKPGWEELWAKALAWYSSCEPTTEAFTGLDSLPQEAQMEALEGRLRDWAEHCYPLIIAMVKDAAKAVEGTPAEWREPLWAELLPVLCAQVNWCDTEQAVKLAQLAELAGPERRDATAKATLEALAPKLAECAEFDLLPLVPLWEQVPEVLQARFSWRPRPASALHQCERAWGLMLNGAGGNPDLESASRGAFEYLSKQLANYSEPPSGEQLQEVRGSLLGALMMLWTPLWLGRLTLLLDDLSNRPIRVEHPPLEYLTQWLDLMTPWLEDPKPLTEAVGKYAELTKDRDLQRELRVRGIWERKDRQYKDFLSRPPVTKVPSRYETPEGLLPLMVVFLSDQFIWSPETDDIGPLRDLARKRRDCPLAVALRILDEDFCKAGLHRQVAVELMGEKALEELRPGEAASLAVTHLRAAITLNQSDQQAWDDLVQILGNQANYEFYKAWEEQLTDAIKRAKSVFQAPDGTWRWDINSTRDGTCTLEDLLELFWSGKQVEDPLNRRYQGN